MLQGNNQPGEEIRDIKDRDGDKGKVDKSWYSLQRLINGY